MTVGTCSPILTQWPDGTYRSGSAPDGLFKLSAPYADGDDIIVESAVLSFGNRTQQSPLIWDRFNGSNGQLLTAYDPAWLAYNGTAGALIGDGSNARYTGGKFAYNTSTRGEFFTNYKTFHASRSRFLSYWWRTSDLQLNNPSYQGVLKMCRLSASAAIGGGGVYSGKGSHYLSALIPQNDGDPFVGYYDSAGVVTDSLGAGGSNEYFELPLNEWTRIDMFVQTSNAGVPNGIFSCNILGGKQWERDDIIDNVAGQPELLIDSIILGLMQANHVGTYSQHITDAYMTDSRARFEVGGYDNYADCIANKKLEIQPYTGWSDKRVKLKANTIALTGDKWLYYTDEGGQINNGTGEGFYLEGV